VAVDSVKPAAVACTSTVSVVAPICSVLFKVSWAAAVSVTPAVTISRKPGWLVLKSYFPYGSGGSVYTPEELVIVVVTTPVSTLRAVTVAPTTAAPLGSLTVPETIASVVWPASDVLETYSAIHRRHPSVSAENKEAFDLDMLLLIRSLIYFGNPADWRQKAIEVF
jgi:hypothetical protein